MVLFLPTDFITLHPRITRTICFVQTKVNKGGHFSSATYLRKIRFVVISFIRNVNRNEGFFLVILFILQLFCFYIRRVFENYLQMLLAVFIPDVCFFHTNNQKNIVTTITIMPNIKHTLQLVRQSRQEENGNYR